MRRSLQILVLAICLVAVAYLALSNAPDAQRVSADTDVIPGRYIVVLKPGSNPSVAAEALGNRFGFEADGLYSRAIQGFAAGMPAANAQALAEHPSVAFVEPDRIMSTTLHANNFQTLPTGVDRLDGETMAGAGIGGSAGPDLDIDVAVIDTGIDVAHPDLQVNGGARFIGPTCSGGSHNDDHGHGTHVAGTIAAKDNSTGVVGVAPGARLWAVKVLDGNGNGFNSCVIQGLDWVTNRRAEFNDGAADGDAGIRIEVANMSIGGGTSAALCTAVANAAAQGVIVAAAAGNESSDASTSSPGNCSAALGVSAYADFDGMSGGLLDLTVSFSNCTENEDDSFACFSNFGPPVDIAAPGVEIVSTYPGGVYAWMSGTSMASPHVAGAAALLKLGGYSGNAQASSVMTALTAAGWTRAQSTACGFTGDVDSSPEPVLFLGTTCGGATPTASPSSTASPTPTAPPTPSPSPTPAPTPTACPGDNDCDGYSNAKEFFLGTNQNAACPASITRDDEAVDAWPPDFDDNQQVSTLDVGRFVLPLNSVDGSALYGKRYDLNEDERINTLDVGFLVFTINQVCS